ncbi:MAG: hypothetical protein P9L92_16735 [Candidatus Electryonea clarkiae]|nr:hypothetical protein [Candidatus Electryonea clarkiae]MDP8285436.1 hypothetical protein [Candidatus Electryonea clarkiae]
MWLITRTMKIYISFLMLVLFIVISGCECEDESNNGLSGPSESDSLYYQINMDFYYTTLNSDDPESSSVSIEIGKFTNINEREYIFEPDEYLTDINVRWGSITRNEATSINKYIFNISESSFADSLELNIDINEELVINQNIYVPEPYEVSGIPDDRTMHENETMEMSLTGSDYFHNAWVKIYDRSDEEERIASGDLKDDMNFYWFVPNIGLDSLRIEVESHVVNAYMWPPMSEFDILSDWEVSGNFYIEVE